MSKSVMILYVKFLASNGWKLSVVLFCFMTIFGDPVLAEAFPEPTIDLYKTDQVSLEELKKKVGNKIKKISNIISSPESLGSSSNMQTVEELMKDVAISVNSMGDFSYANVIPVLYPNDKVIHFTIDIVDKKDAHRLSCFLPKPDRNIEDSERLIKNWLAYEEEGFSFVWKEKKFPKFKKCPAHHCIFGFEHSKLKKYQNLFNTLVPKHKKKLVTILRQDKDEQKRASAAFLLAHLKDGSEIIDLLSPSIFDASGKVRNNVMRVLATIAANEPDKRANFPIEKITAALDFPKESDRNKALLIILSLVDDPKQAKYVKKHASQLLVAHLKLLQPNLHQTSFNILTKISKKNYSEHDYEAWEQWAKVIPKTKKPKPSV